MQTEEAEQSGEPAEEARGMSQIACIWEGLLVVGVLGNQVWRGCFGVRAS